MECSRITYTNNDLPSRVDYALQLIFPPLLRMQILLPHLTCSLLSSLEISAIAQPIADCVGRECMKSLSCNTIRNLSRIGRRAICAGPIASYSLNPSSLRVSPWYFASRSTRAQLEIPRTSSICSGTCICLLNDCWCMLSGDADERLGKRRIILRFPFCIFLFF